MLAPCKEMHLPRSRLQRDRRRIERGRRAPDHCDGFVRATPVEIDRIRRMRIKLLWQVAATALRERYAPPLLGEAAGKNDLPRRLGRDRPTAISICSRRWSLCRLDAEQPGPVAQLDAERLAVPVEIGRPVDPRNAIQRVIGRCAMAGLIPGPGSTGPASRAPAPAGPSAYAACACARWSARRRTPAPSLAASITVTLPMPGTTQGEGERASGLSSADDDDVMVNALTIRDPVLLDRARSDGEYRGQHWSGS